MKGTWVAFTLFTTLVLAIACSTDAQGPPQNAPVILEGTSWQLVKFEGGDGRVLTPEDKMNYTIVFGTDGRINARIACNRGTGSWKSSGPNHLEFGPLALTRAACPPEALNERMAKDWDFVRSYVIKDDHLFLSLMADSGIYEFEPIGRSRTTGAGF